MKVLVVGDAASVNVRRWCEGLVAAGADVSMLSFEPAWTAQVPVHRLPFATLGAGRYFAAAPIARVKAKRLNPDLVVGYYVTGYGTVARLTDLHPLVLVTAGRDVEENPAGTTLHRLTRRNLSSADLVIAWGEHMGRAAQRFGAASDRIMVQPRGIPLAGYVTKVPDATRAGTKVIVTRSLEPVYRHDAIVRAIAQVEDPPLELTVVGDGSLRGTLVELVDQLGIGSRVHFAGRVPNDELPALLADHDLYVSARPHDGVSASLLEAMAAGLVPVVPDHPANRDWITDGETGRLIHPGTDDLADAMRGAATDVAMRKRAAEVNPRVVHRKGSLEANMPKFVEAFHRLLSENS